MEAETKASAAATTARAELEAGRQAERDAAWRVEEVAKRRQRDESRRSLHEPGERRRADAAASAGGAARTRLVGRTKLVGGGDGHGRVSH
jgi:hypothetical protein